MPGFQLFSQYFLHGFVLPKLASISIRVNMDEDFSISTLTAMECQFPFMIYVPCWE